MRERITNPEYNQKTIEKMKSECPVVEFDACYWFNNGCTKQFMWWCVFIDNARKEE